MLDTQIIYRATCKCGHEMNLVPDVKNPHRFFCECCKCGLSTSLVRIRYPITHDGKELFWQDPADMPQTDPDGTKVWFLTKDLDLIHELICFSGHLTVAYPDNWLMSGTGWYSQFDLPEWSHKTNCAPAIVYFHFDTEGLKFEQPH